MELYTSLVRFKQALNDGTLPPMTPVPENVRHFINPAFTIGLGALTEDASLGLRCPVCGVYRHHIKRHFDTAHAAIGGAASILSALSIPPTVSLMSQKAIAIKREQASRPEAIARSLGVVDRSKAKAAGDAVRAGNGAIHSLTSATVNTDNLGDKCCAQLTRRILVLHHELGREPTDREFAARYGRGKLRATYKVFGSWRNALGQCGLKMRGAAGHIVITADDVVEAMRVWYKKWGYLPDAGDIQNAQRTPLTPGYTAILKAFDVSSYPEAMRRVAARLNIYGGRYGLPETESPSDSSTCPIGRPGHS